MIYLLHGDDVVASRDRLVQLTSEFSSITYLDAEKISSADLTQSLATNDLFLEKKCVVIEKVLKLPKKDLEALQELLNAQDKTTTVILWHNTELSKTFLVKFKSAKVESFVFPKLFFKFLDSFTPSSLKNELELLLKMQNVEAEQIFYALVKRVRQLILVKTGSVSDEVAKMNPWQRDKLRIQSSKFRVDELEKIYEKLFELEVKMKSGGLMLPLKKHLDILLIDELH